MVKPIINWALSNSLNAYNRHSDYKRATRTTYLTAQTNSLCYKRATRDLFT